jgi:hypothetical protein
MGGRSTYGLCLGALSWLIEDGRAGETALDGLRVVLAARYSDDEDGSPWSFVLYLDEHGDDSQREALEAIFTGRLPGSQIDHFPWVWKESRQLAVRPAKIELEHVPGRGWFRAGSHVEVRAARPVASGETVTCVIPGHERAGRELHAETLEVHDGELDFSFRGTCAFESDFDYCS